MSHSQSEFTVLRQTIATRGTVRMALLPITLIGWTATTVALLHVRDAPYSFAFPLVSLMVLVGGFEAIHALHVGVERIGRYLQVYYEGQPDGPRWETTIMPLGPALPGGGIDPLFTVVFVAASGLNLASVLLSGPTLTEGLVVGALHALVCGRIIRASWAAARQRAVDLETFRAIKSGQDEANA